VVEGLQRTGTNDMCPIDVWEPFSVGKFVVHGICLSEVRQFVYNSNLAWCMQENKYPRLG
jgi:hypothetical protein